MNKPILNSSSFKFSQEGNCNGTTGLYEYLDISYDSDLGLDRTNEGFFVLRTEGWSVDGVEELEELFDRIRNVLNTKKK
jgi:hypothetical protein